MLFKTLFIAVIIISHSVVSEGQDYATYQQIFNRVDEDLHSNQQSKALIRLDTISVQYDFVYARHCFKALQLCCIAQDAVRAEYWLYKSVARGVPIWMIRADSVASKSLRYTNTETWPRKYDSLQNVYYASVNTSIAKRIDSLLQADQYLTGKVNDGFILSRAWNDIFRWKKNNTSSYKAVYNIMQQHGFPGERLIGLPEDLRDSTEISYTYFMRFGIGTLKDHRAYTMLIHYFSDKRPPIDSLLYKNVLNGYLPAYQYGALCDFMSRYGRKNSYYNIWHFAKEPNQLNDINARRALIGLNSFEQQQDNRTYNAELRKQKQQHTKVLMEDNR